MRRPAINVLDFKLDQLAAEQGYVLFSTILQLSPTSASSIDDSTLAGIAKDAFIVMRGEDDQNWLEVKRAFQVDPRTSSCPFTRDDAPPGAVAAMLVNNQILISSSMKAAPGKPSFRMTRQGNRRVDRLLSSICKHCGNMEEHPNQSTHHYMAQCAEIMALHQWANFGGGRTAELRKGKIMTVQRDYEAKGVEHKIEAPCRPKSEDGYSCGPVLVGLNLRALDENTVIPAVTRNLRLRTATQVTVLYRPNLVDRISIVEEMVCYHHSLKYRNT